MASHAQVEEWWADYRCNTTNLVYLDVNERYPVKMQSLLEDATMALETAIMGVGYRTPMGPTGSYNCRHIGGDDSNAWSLHAYAVAIDWDYGENPHLRSDNPDPVQRGFGTDPRFELTEAHVDAVEAIVNEEGEQLWRWLGWGPPEGINDTMHFSVNVPPDRCQPATKDEQMSYEDFANEWLNYVSDEDLMNMSEAGLFNGHWSYWATVRDAERSVEQRREVARFRTVVEVGGWTK
jgi:hypothetical protein